MKTTKRNIEKARKLVRILDILVDSTHTGEVLMRVKDKISHNSKFYITTPNPELVLMAQSDKELKTALNSAHFSIPDGIGLSQAAKLLSFRAPKNKTLRFLVTFFQGLYVGLLTFIKREELDKSLKVIKGRELLLDLIDLADKNSWRLFFLGGEKGEAIESARKLSEKYKTVKIMVDEGPKFNNNGEPDTEVDKRSYLDIVKKINLFKPHLLIAGLQDPKEEKFVYKNYKKLNIIGAAAFGGAFRYIAGQIKNPPKWMENIGLEWLWRIVNEPYRAKRIFNALIRFPIEVWKRKAFTS